MALVSQTARKYRFLHNNLDLSQLQAALIEETITINFETDSSDLEVLKIAHTTSLLVTTSYF